jgi:hypothetical protein
MKIYFAMGGIDKFRMNVFNSCGVKNVLVSYADTNGKAEMKLPYPDIILDSGAFGVETGHQRVSVEAYTLWLELYLDKYPQVKAYVNLDDLSSPETSLSNQRYMEAHDLKPMPVYHYGEPTEYLDKMCSQYEYVGLGGMAVGQMPTGHLKTFWEFVYEKYKDNRFHVFGVGSMTAFHKYQPYSVDSASWAAATKFGHIAGYKDGIPQWSKFAEKKTGWQLFFTSYELWSANLRAMMDWEKLEWLKNVGGNDTDQGRLF